jgi:SAM-dependent methyltransferase
VPQPLLSRARTSLRLRALDLRDRVSGRADPLVPPRRMDFVGHSDFAATGDEFLEHFVTLAGLTPDERVLDIGCGIGRMARPLTGFLSPQGSYDGFDINPEGIAWCAEHYAEHPNFRFVLADLHNSRYHPEGAAPAAEYRFPYEDGSFDLAIATSVWTHLLEPEADNYLAETARVLAPGGRALITFFLLDEGSRAAIAAGRATLAFRAPEGDVAVVDPAVPEEAVAFSAGWLDAALARHGLRRRDAHPGAWRGAPGRSYQDLVILERPA